MIYGFRYRVALGKFCPDLAVEHHSVIGRGPQFLRVAGQVEGEYQGWSPAKAAAVTYSLFTKVDDLEGLTPDEECVLSRLELLTGNAAHAMMRA